MSRIVVAVDESRIAEKVVEESCQLAKELDSSIVLLHVIRNLPEEPEAIKAFEETEHSHEAYLNYLDDIGKAVTAKLSDKIEKQDIECVIMTEFGNPVEKILETARLQDASMIVLGIHGHHSVGLIRSLGSVARKVIENATCPVVAVP
jgi:nucleotide-binding universal stress UspA family protein